MNELRLQRLLRRVLLSTPLPLAVLGAACGGSSITELSSGGSASGGQPARAGADAGGAPSAGASNGGEPGIAGAVSAGAGGAIDVAGAGGALTAGAGGAAGAAASAGMGAGGSTNEECRSHLGFSCNPFTVTIARSCLDPALAVMGTQLSQPLCNSICNANYVFNCTVSGVTASEASVYCNPGCAVGRRPEGMLETSAFDGHEVGGYFAQTAQLEAASVTAFRVLRDELREAGAPKALLRAAARAARDEIRHTRATGALARRFGSRPQPATIGRTARRSLEAIALENAIEGCVRETYGALLATRQAQLARDPVVRAVMVRIARDETRHASLSWRVGRWLETRLDPAARRNVQRAKQRAARELTAALTNEPAHPFADLAGLPSPAEAVQLAEHMTRLLWS